MSVYMSNINLLTLLVTESSESSKVAYNLSQSEFASSVTYYLNFMSRKFGARPFLRNGPSPSLPPPSSLQLVPPPSTRYLPPPGISLQPGLQLQACSSWLVLCCCCTVQPR